MSNSHRRFVASSFAAVLVAVTACGDDGGNPPIDAPRNDAAIDAAAIDAAIDAPPPLDAAPGQIWIRGNGITGASGKIVLTFITASGGGSILGGICVPVSADPMSFVAAVHSPGTGNPCDLGGVASFSDGIYNVTAGIYTPGQQVPDQCANTTVTVAGSGDVTLPAFSSCL